MLRNALFFASASLIVGSAQAQTTADLKLGIEAVTGLRSGYIHRGFDLADSSLEFQLQAEFALSNRSALNFGLWHLAESDGDFSGSSAYLEFDHRIGEQLWVGAGITYRDFDESILGSGLDLGTFVRYRPHDDWTLSGELHYDFAVDGWYAESELEWSQALSDSAFLTISSGVSFVSDYESTSGFQDIFSRVTLTYALSDTVSFTPFVGSSIALQDRRSNEAFGGIWFEFIF